MWFSMRREALDFPKRAPVVYVNEAEVRAPRRAVFGAFAEPLGWREWFPNVRQAIYSTPPPHGVGTIRESFVGSTQWVEEMIAWDEGALWAWTVLRATVPLARAQVETFEFADAGDGTRVRWTLALEPRLLARLSGPFTANVAGRMLGKATRNLAVYLQTRQPQRIAE